MIDVDKTAIDAEEDAGPLMADGALWVFGYGSLMWRPDFEHQEKVMGRCIGVRRSFCVWSVYHRGTPRRPGLVLGLEAGGMCEGMLYHVPAALVRETVRQLRAREQVTNVYRETFRQVELMDGSGRAVRALCYVTDRSHPQYAPRLTVLQKAEIIKRSNGRSGHNLDYLAETLKYLRRLGVRDDEMERVLVLTRSLHKYRRFFAADGRL